MKKSFLTENFKKQSQEPTTTNFASKKITSRSRLVNSKKENCSVIVRVSKKQMIFGIRRFPESFSAITTNLTKKTSDLKKSREEKKIDLISYLRIVLLSRI